MLKVGSIPTGSTMEKQCVICEKTFKTKGLKCRSCQVNLRRFSRRTDIINYLGGACYNCGYNRCYGALDVHHLDPSKKEFNISGSHTRRWAIVEEELAKCVLLCSNCHKEEHHNCYRYNCPI